MHLMVVIQESNPGKEMTGYIGKFIRKIASKQYTAPFVSDAWSRIRPREIRFFDFIIPECIEKEVLEDLAPYTGGKLQKLSKIASIPILKDIIGKKLGIKPIDMTEYRAKISAPKTRKRAEVPVYISILGKVEDGHTEDGVELL